MTMPVAHDVLDQVRDLLDDLFDPWKDSRPVKPSERAPHRD